LYHARAHVFDLATHIRDAYERTKDHRRDPVDMRRTKRRPREPDQADRLQRGG
jgi:hypothetical protein